MNNKLYENIIKRLINEANTPPGEYYVFYNGRYFIPVVKVLDGAALRVKIKRLTNDSDVNNFDVSDYPETELAQEIDSVLVNQIKNYEFEGVYSVAGNYHLSVIKGDLHNLTASKFLNKLEATDELIEELERRTVTGGRSGYYEVERDSHAFYYEDDKPSTKNIRGAVLNEIEVFGPFDGYEEIREIINIVKGNILQIDSIEENLLNVIREHFPKYINAAPRHGSLGKVEYFKAETSRIGEWEQGQYDSRALDIDINVEMKYTVTNTELRKEINRYYIPNNYESVEKNVTWTTYSPQPRGWSYKMFDMIMFRQQEQYYDKTTGIGCTIRCFIEEEQYDKETGKRYVKVLVTALYQVPKINS